MSWVDRPLAVSFKALCLMHLRDAAVESFRTLGALLNDPHGPITWSTMQRLLHQDAFRPGHLKDLLAQGRLSAEQEVFGRQAFDFLVEAKARRSRRSDGVHQNIFELVWLYGFRQDQVVQTRSLYRGQFDSRWRQVSSLLRGEPLDVQTLVHRVQRTEAFVATLRARQAEFFAQTPRDDELLAVAQHYGFETPLLDYTASLRVAAWFATSKAPRVDKRYSTVGVIYLLAYQPEDARQRPVADNPGIGQFRLLDGAAVHVGHVSYLQPQLAASDNRIQRQQGLFVAGFAPRDLHGVVLSSLYFWQEPGEVFEDPVAGVTAGHLLPDDSPLARLAEEVKGRFDAQCAPPVVAALGATELPEPGIFGSKGFALRAAITDGRLFFKSLEHHVARLQDAAYVAQTLAAVFDDYFGRARIRADLGAASAAKPAQADPFQQALIQLAMLSGADAPALEAATRQALAPTLWGFREWSASGLALKPGNDAERIALACSIYLASWEILQHVHGDAARDVASSAWSVFGLVDDQRRFPSAPT